ncbi:unnamed protein product [Closterium sp. NIES-54]
MGFISPTNSSTDLSGELVPDDATIEDIDATECVRCCPCLTTLHRTPPIPTAPHHTPPHSAMGFISPTNSSWELTGELVPDDAIIEDMDATECVCRCPCLTALHRTALHRTPSHLAAMGFISPTNSSWDLTGELVPDDAIIEDIDATECVRRCQTYPGPCVTAQYVPGMQRCVLKKEYGTAVSTMPGFLAFVKKCAVDNGGCGQHLCQQGQPNTCIDPKGG